MNLRKTLILTALIFSGESIFILPFLVSRIFRPTFLKVFDITNFELGSAFAVYGLVATVSYFFGGPLADRLSAKRLMSFSLLITAMGGIVMYSIPSLFILTILYAFWGLTTILLFWAAFIKVTRESGGEKTQGLSFGTVDAGRGLFAAALASVSVLLFDTLLPTQVELATTNQLANALGGVILLFSSLTFACSLLIWWLIPDNSSSVTTDLPSWEGVKKAMKNTSIWWQALIVLCAYVGYKCTDDFSLYASEVLGYNDVEAAHVGTISHWMRPLAALSAGLLGDRFLHSKMISFLFLLIVIGSLIISFSLFPATLAIPIIITIASISIGIYGLRGLYFALLEEAKFSLIYTGSAVGIVSVLGYTPDIFMGPLMGYVLDNSPGEAGHQQLFAILAAFALLGFITTFLFRYSYQRKLKQ